MKTHLSPAVWSDESLSEASNPHIRLGCREALSTGWGGAPIPPTLSGAAETFPELRSPRVCLGKDASVVIPVCSVWGFVFLLWVLFLVLVWGYFIIQKHTSSCPSAHCPERETGASGTL